MAIRDVLLTLTSYPDPTPVSVIDRAVSLASTLAAHVAAISCEAHVQVPGSFLGGAGNLGSIVTSEVQKSRRNARDLLATFELTAQKAGVLHETVLERCLTSEVPDLLVEYARLRDLTIVPVPISYDQWYAEAIIFGAGRPTLVVPEAPPSRTFELNRVLVAWDFSRAAARAVSDAIPILEKAREVRILTVTNEKAIPSKRSASELAKNLSRHGMDVIVEEVDAAGRAIGDVLAAQIESRRADLLVMGAYGHSRFREFILGGATRSILTKPPIPVLLSH
ncbi:MULTISPECIES: universal stress protein [Bradyrhizobium]|uniref:Nucleotide-binding universal stress UspA family protein n=1 Tax=Bradyrhizobium elkanii TaxID=29448 RepID=A0A8I2C1Q0_BRAEL|nr:MULTISPECIES: universal stress protein [Bradyrhizobium]MBP1290963.1 nucleotide-binding universal stress UspA family protein [Bradyrhizobium elkanii]MCP1928722.1 nucleotide-binding universal stress UspA family protein [Bradyrhizobium elkanii]MCS3473956.1 nucleotide-binding universal stress UspA family protein [Bradyrhizobium elkanii]MCS3580663.1 nucleotide-binding universal stress UspA family protein [Bradyrhizobium elkanii]MCS3723539.1 nucleotide-binding universal stress UspA family protein